MNAVGTFFRELPLKPQGVIVVIAAFLPIIAIVAMGPVVPTLIGHFADNPDARWMVPTMVGAPGLAIALISPFAGLLVDRFGRRKLLLVSTLLYGVFGSAPFFLDDLNQIFASRLLMGVTEAGILTVVNTLIGDYWDESGRKNWLFLQGLLGPFLAGFVQLLTGYSANLQWNGVFLVYLVAFPVWAAMLVWLFEPKRETGDAPASTEAVAAPTQFPVGEAAIVAAVTLFVSLLYYVFIINGALAFAEVGVADPFRYSQLIFWPSQCVLLGAAVYRLLADRPNTVQIAVLLALMGTGLAGIGSAASVPMVLASLVIQQTAAGMAVPTLIGWAQTKFSFANRGRGMGVWNFAFFFSQAASPFLVGQISGALGSMQAAFLVAGVAGIAGALVALVMTVTRRSQAVAA